MAFVDQLLNRNAAQGNCSVPGKGKCVFNSFPTLLRSNQLGSMFFAPSLDTLDNNLVDRTEVTALDLFLNQPFCFRFDVDCHRTYPARLGRHLHDRTMIMKSGFVTFPLLCDRRHIVKSMPGTV